MKTAVYAGSFDPLTNGHVWMIQEASKLFDKLIVAIGINPDKKSTFTIQERIEMLKKSVSHLKNVEIQSFENKFLVHYARQEGIEYIVRGIRNDSDYEFERMMRHVNQDIYKDVSTVFLMPSREMSEVSSSLVKGLIGPEGWEAIIRKYVPKAVYIELLKKFNGGKNSWMRLCKDLNIPTDKAEEIYKELLHIYSEPNRQYHNIAHIVNGLEYLRENVGTRQEIELAFWFHDALYNTTRKDNEEQSAVYMALMMKGLIPDSYILAVRDLIMATKYDNEFGPNEKEEYKKIISDIDFRALAESKEEYDFDEDCIRQEYSWVSDEDFQKGRGDFLKKVLGWNVIFRTPTFFKKFEATARENISGSKYIKG